MLPKSSILDLVRIQRAFLWGGTDSNTKIPWVSWDDICKPKSEGGLGIRDLECFNKALVGKWIWRILNKKETLWVKILLSKYGSLEESRNVACGGRGALKVSNWWKELCRLYWGHEGNGMRKEFLKKLGRGEDTLFWHDLWIGEEILSLKFPRLYRISGQKNHKISEMGRWCQNSWVWELEWDRSLSP